MPLSLSVFFWHRTVLIDVTNVRLFCACVPEGDIFMLYWTTCSLMSFNSFCFHTANYIEYFRWRIPKKSFLFHRQIFFCRTHVWCLFIYLLHLRMTTQNVRRWLSLDIPILIVYVYQTELLRQEYDLSPGCGTVSRHTGTAFSPVNINMAAPKETVYIQNLLLFISKEAYCYLWPKYVVINTM